jgi:hypothetical protein
MVTRYLTPQGHDLKVRAFQLLARTLAVIALLTLPARAQEIADWSPDAAAIRKALGGLVTGVEQSARVHGPILGDVGQFTLRLSAGSSEAGVFVRAYRYPAEQTPIFWVNLTEEPGQTVVRAQNGQIGIDAIPGDWLASDYLRERKPAPDTVSFIAINPPRHVRPEPGGDAIVAESDFDEFRNVLARSRFWIDKTTKDTRAFCIMVYNVHDEALARRMADALEQLRD